MKSTGNNSRPAAGLPRSAILRGKLNFQRLFREGSILSEQHVSLRYVLLPDAPGSILVGFITGRRLGKAHERNLVRRRLREAYRLNQHISADSLKESMPGVHAAFIARTTQVSFSVLQKECVHLLRQLNIKLEQYN